MSTPFGDHTNNTSVTWYPEPRGRGTFNVLSTCLTIMILCVWTAVHLNIPEHNGGMKQSFLRKPGWLLMALIAPEIVAFNAWQQRRIARELTNDFIEAFEPRLPIRLGWIQRLRNVIKSDSARSKEPSTNSEQEYTSNGRSKITLVHGFYAAMGGYVIQTHFMDGQYPITGQGRLTLTKNGIKWLLKHCPEVFPDITEAELLDKSKASALVKTLTCLQAFWFCVQCVVRLMMNTSISLLELNVFGHCIFTFIIYAFWWNKPMDITEPTVIDIKDKPEHEGIVALLCSFTSRTVPRLHRPLDGIVETGYRYTRRTDPPRSRTKSRWLGPGFHRCETEYRFDLYTNFHTTFHATRSSVRNQEKEFHRTGSAFDVDTDERRVVECAGLQVEQVRRLFDIDDSHPQIKVAMYKNPQSSTFRITVGTKDTGLTYHLSRDQLHRLRIEPPRSGQKNSISISKEADEKPSDYRLEQSYLAWLDTVGRDPESYTYPSHYRPDRPCLDRIHNWTFRLNSESQERLKSRFWLSDDFVANTLPIYVMSLLAAWGTLTEASDWLVLFAAAFVYGKLHLLAWNAPFHAPIDGLLWRISGIVVASLGVLPILLMLSMLISPGYGWDNKSLLLSCLKLIVTVLTLLATILFPVVYILARVYLVVESFLSLAYLPESVLVTPNFSLYFPHIG